MKQRNQGLDALRGLAIFGMVLAGSIAFGILPAWMYHAQEPPPSHQFNPQLPGISWVDLVFPFFLFSMGAAIPLSLRKKMNEKAGFFSIAWQAARRSLLLVFFALFSRQMTSAAPGVAGQVLAILAFGILFVLFFRSPAGSRLWQIIKGVAVVLTIVLLFVLPFDDNKGFSFYRSDVIILILANVSFTGTCWWYGTRNRPVWRLALLPILAGIYLSGAQPGNWCYEFLQWSPFPWLYRAGYMQYLFILLPGTLAGEWMQEYGNTVYAPCQPELRNIRLAGLAAVAVLVCNVCLLFGRHTTINLFSTLAGLLLCYLALRTLNREHFRLMYLFLQSAAYLVVLGLCFESFEGGIKKDPATFSYYFVTTGLAFLVLFIFCTMQYDKAGQSIIHYLSVPGRNPMVAYVAGNLLLLPLLQLTGVIDVFNAMGQQAVSGVLRGFLFTGLVTGLAAWFASRQWYWKT